MAGIPRGGGGIPTSPFEMEATKEILARRIEAGDIQQSDLDLLKRGYKMMTTASFVGSIGMAIPTVVFLRRKQPRVGLGVQLLAAGGMGMLGSFLGFTVGGAAAAAEVNRSMENPQQKLRVFAEIATEARKASIERSTGAIPSSSRSSPPGALGSRPRPQESIGIETSPSTWATESALDRSEMAAESAREAGYKGDVGAIRRDSGFATPAPAPIAGTEVGGGGGIGGGSAGGSDSWSQLRKGAKPRVEDAGVGRAEEGRKADARTKEQREFDALLERERKGLGAGDDKWA